MLRAVLNHLRTLVFLGDKDTTRRSRSAWVLEVENVPGMFGKKRPISAATREVIRFIEKREDLAPFLTTIKRSAISIKKVDEQFEIWILLNQDQIDQLDRQFADTVVFRELKR